MTFLNQANDYECCSPGIALLFEVVFYVKDEESSGYEGETADATAGYERPGNERIERRGST